MSIRLKGRTALVTGAGQGIGQTYALALAKEGANICVSDVVSTQTTVDLIEDIGGSAIGIHADISDRSSLNSMMSDIEREFGGLDILVNNAALFGSLNMSPFEDISPDEWDKVMTINVRGTWETIVAAMPLLRASDHAKIVNVASAIVFKGSPLMLHYVASKGAVVALTRSLARELSADKITCNAIAPGLVMSKSIQDHADWKEVSAANIGSRAIKREAEPEDLIGALLFLSSDDSNFVTGQTLVVDGGSVMR